MIKTIFYGFFTVYWLGSFIAIFFGYRPDIVLTALLLLFIFSHNLITFIELLSKPKTRHFKNIKEAQDFFENERSKITRNETWVIEESLLKNE